MTINLIDLLPIIPFVISIFFLFYVINTFGGTTLYRYNIEKCFKCKEEMKLTDVDSFRDTRDGYCNNKKCSCYGIKRVVDYKIIVSKYFTLMQANRLGKEGMEKELDKELQANRGKTR